MAELNGIFRLFRFSGILGQPREVHPKFRKEILGNVCSIRFHSPPGIFGGMPGIRPMCSFRLHPARKKVSCHFYWQVAEKLKFFAFLSFEPVPFNKFFSLYKEHAVQI